MNKRQKKFQSLQDLKALNNNSELQKAEKKFSILLLAKNMETSIDKMIEDGARNTDIAQTLGISVRMLYDDKDLCQWLADKRDIRNKIEIEMAEKSLMSKVLGQKVVIKKTDTYKTRKKNKQLVNGEIVETLGEYEEKSMHIIEEEVFLPPEQKAIEFYLSNKDPQNWQPTSKLQVEVKDNSDGFLKFMQILTESENIADAEVVQ